MNDIEKLREETWNKRLKACIEKNGYTSQISFIKSFNKKYGTSCTQKDVSRWIHVGELKTEKSNDTAKATTKIGFPSYLNMLHLADFLM